MGGRAGVAGVWAWVQDREEMRQCRSGAVGQWGNERHGCGCKAGWRCRAGGGWEGGQVRVRAGAPPHAQAREQALCCSPPTLTRAFVHAGRGLLQGLRQGARRGPARVGCRARGPLDTGGQGGAAHGLRSAAASGMWGVQRRRPRPTQPLAHHRGRAQQQLRRQEGRGRMRSCSCSGCCRSRSRGRGRRRGTPRLTRRGRSRRQRGTRRSVQPPRSSG